jgi:hypothetical protein
MAKKKSGKRGSGIIALIAVIAAIAGGPSAASANPGHGQGQGPVAELLPVQSDIPFLDASWAEE